MKKIMFSDKYGLTAAVLAGTKTQTRRIMTRVLPEIQELRVVNNVCEYKDPYVKKWYKCNSKHQPKYKVGEKVAVAQCYRHIYCQEPAERLSEEYSMWFFKQKGLTDSKAWRNKMFVKSDFMPHYIRIENVRVERLQDISEDDCLAEGITKYADSVYTYIENGKKIFRANLDTPRKAYAELINKISGKGVWNSNPWVFLYDFKLVK